MMTTVIRYITLLYLTIIMTMPAAQASALIDKGIIKSTDMETIIRFSANQAITFNSFRLDNPPRLVIDIPQAQLRHKSSALHIENDKIKSIRLGTQQGTDLRIVVDLRTNIPASAGLLKTKKSYIIEIKVGNALNMSSGRTISKTLPNASRQIISDQPIQTAKTVKKKQITIVIDPGHGGKDPGAIGKTGIQEKKIVLAIAKELQILVNNNNGMRAILTRNGDQFIPLRERVLFARRNQADMFLSIHADAGSLTADGASVYILSTSGASSEMAKLLAKRENQSDLIGGIQISNKDADIASMLLDLSIDATIESSNELGNQILNGLKQNSGLHKKNVERAAFAVLKAPDIPSILIETGFISNPREERKLSNSSHQKKLAASIMKGIKLYFKARPATELIITNNKSKDITQNSFTEKIPPIILSSSKITRVTDTLPPISLSAHSNQTNVISKRNKVYITQKSDTLRSIAIKMHVSETRLKAINNLSPNQLRVPAGTSISVP